MEGKTVCILSKVYICSQKNNTETHNNLGGYVKTTYSEF